MRMVVQFNFLSSILLFGQMLLKQDGGPQGISTGGHWGAEEATKHTNVLELRAATLALQAFLPPQLPRPKHVHLQIDNTTAVAYINKRGGTRSLFSQPKPWNYGQWPWMLGYLCLNVISPEPVSTGLQDYSGQVKRTRNNVGGRPRKLIKRNERKLLRAMLSLRKEEEQFSSCRLMERAGIGKDAVSNRKIRRVLRGNGFFYLQARKKELMS